MNSKTFEVRDRATFIPVLAIQLSPSCEADRYLLARAGFGTVSTVQERYVLLIHLHNNTISYDPYSWLENGTRTMHLAHKYIILNFADLKSGAVIDVEYISGESSFIKISEAIECEN